MYRFIFLLLISTLLSNELPKGLTDWELDNMHIIDEMKKGLTIPERKKVA